MFEVRRLLSVLENIRIGSLVLEYYPDKWLIILVKYFKIECVW